MTWVVVLLICSTGPKGDFCTAHVPPVLFLSQEVCKVAGDGMLHLTVSATNDAFEIIHASRDCKNIGEGV